MSEADLRGAGLQGANLRQANLQGVNLDEAKLDEQTTLPNGSKWLPECDMMMFTDPQHVDFWRSIAPGMPAYGGDENREG